MSSKFKPESTLIILKTTKIYGKGRTQIPPEVRKKLGLKDGDSIAWIEDLQGNIMIKPRDFMY